jgi:hypothetical protein
MSDFEDKYKTKHKNISIIKSCVRIGAAISCAIMILFGLPVNSVVFSFMIVFTLAELFGIMEEMI